MFPNPLSSMPYHSTAIQKRYLKPSGVKLGLGADQLAHVPSYLPVVAGRDRSTDEGPTGTHASRLDPDHDERVRTGDAGVEEGSQWKGSHDGAQALAGERLK